MQAEIVANYDWHKGPFSWPKKEKKSFFLNAEAQQRKLGQFFMPSPVFFGKKCRFMLSSFML
jgi:hypothetical protein